MKGARTESFCLNPLIKRMGYILCDLGGNENSASPNLHDLIKKKTKKKTCLRAIDGKSEVSIKKTL